MASTFTMRSLLRALPTTTRQATPRPTAPSLLLPTTPPSTQRAALSTTPALHNMKRKKKPPVVQKVSKTTGLAMRAARDAAKKKKAQQNQKLDPKVAAMMSFLYAPTQTPAPLRMARNRQVRHWTIHRAWLLLQRRKEKQLHRELMGCQQSMANACEELRNLEGPGTRPEGWLYRRAMEKAGLWMKQAVPIEYARPLVETPGYRPWNHDWKRL